MEVLGWDKTNKNLAKITPFYFDDTYSTSPSEFEISIYSKELDKEFRYGFSCDKDVIYEEWLFMKKFSKTPNLLEKCVFYRKKNEEIISDLKDEVELKEIKFVESMTTDNELVITNIGKRGNVKYREVYDWFYSNSEYLNFSSFNESVLFDDQHLLRLLLEHKEIFNDVKEFVNKVDSAIKDIKIEEIEDNQMNKLYKAYAGHKKENSDFVYVPFHIESCGTKKLFSFAVDILFSLNLGIPLFIDEMDSKLHPLILRYIVKLYSNKDTNVGGGQLIFSSHNLVCLDSSDLRRDEIWFVEKKEQKSSMFSLYDFKEVNVRNDLDFGKNYLSGRFGAIPFDDEV